MGLIVHTGSCSPATEEEVKAIVAPETTDTYRPVSHRQMIELLNDTCERVGIRALERRYAVSVKKPKPSKDGPLPDTIVGNRMFGYWILDNHSNGSEWAIGFRNSYDKSMSIGLTAGQRVMVCDNLAFSGDYVALRKHTSGLDDDELQRIVQGAVVKVMKRVENMGRWMMALKKFSVNGEEAMVILVEGMLRGIFPSSHFKRVYKECWQQEKLLAEQGGHPLTLNTMFNTFTRYTRDQDLFKISERTAKAEQLIDEMVALRNVV